jgi:hypothetical protein
MAERDGGGSSEGEWETEDSAEDLRGPLGGSVGGWEGMFVNLLDAVCFLRKGILSFVVDVLAALDEEDRG